MSDKNITVANDVVVSMAYALRINDGQLIDQSKDDAPLEYIQGAGQIIPGLEKELYGMNIGDEKEVQVKPVDGYGERDPDEVVEIPRQNLSESLELTVGKPLNVKDAESGEEFRAYVVKSNPETVTLDFNHPLAGRILNFHVKITNLRQATEEELAHRHVHGDNHAH
jgi:FKBP-type peptidyl-prolyl cis-trans isomerase SlyD